jgi:hypothetical protein
MGEVRPVRVRRGRDHAMHRPAHAALKAHEGQALRCAAAVAEMTAIPLQWIDVRDGDTVVGPGGPAFVVAIGSVMPDRMMPVFWTRNGRAGRMEVDAWTWVPVEPRADPMVGALATIYRAFPATQIMG